MQDLIGHTLKDRYRIETYLGRGNLTDVYQVRDMKGSFNLVLKLLRPDLAEDPVFIRRFQGEAQSLSSLEHPHIVRYYGLEQEDLQAFLLMDYVDGSSLRQAIMHYKQRGLPLVQIQKIASAVCSALYYAHKNGFVHGELKPSNILFDKSGKVMVTDFGIARIAENITGGLMSTRSPSYLAPELLRGQPHTPQTDIYALGVTLYEALTGGERPFTGERAPISLSAVEKIAWEQLNQEPYPVTHYDPDVPSQLNQIIMRCLDKNPKQRYRSAMDLLSDLNNAMIPASKHYNGQREAPAPELKTEQNAPEPPQDFSTSGRPPAWIWPIFIGVILIMILLLVVFRNNLIPSNSVVVSLTQSPTIETTQPVPTDNIQGTSTRAEEDIVISSPTTVITPTSGTPVSQSTGGQNTTGAGQYICAANTEGSTGMLELLTPFGLTYDVKDTYEQCIITEEGGVEGCSETVPLPINETEGWHVLPANARIIIPQVDNQADCEAGGGKWLLLAIEAAGVTPATATPAADTQTSAVCDTWPERVLLISFDGLRPDSIYEQNASPTLMELAMGGAYTWDAETTIPSASLPGHTSMFTGLGSDKHGIKGISPEEMPSEYLEVPTIFTRLEAHNPDATTAMYVGKKKMNFFHQPVIDLYEWYRPAQGSKFVVNQAIATMQNQDFDLMFLHLPEADIKGEDLGFGTAAYYDVVRSVDPHISRLIAALRENGLLESTLILVTADHGGEGHGHSDSTVEDRRIPFILSGPCVKQGYEIQRKVWVMDAAATILWVFDIPIEEGDLDGLPVMEAFLEKPK